jgi:peptidoglycan/xylan/chitin deacetylase (PgdA/CDA1 family)
LKIYFKQEGRREVLPLRGVVVTMLCLLSGCQSLLRTEQPAPAPLPVNIRFLLTFDDGPSILAPQNPTLSILAQLADNDIQPGIKAIFFVQTRNANGGGTEIGKAIMRRAYSAGHVLGLHSASPRGHVGHIRMSSDELNQSLQDGIADIRGITGHDPEFVRPPFWAFTPRTQSLYAANHLNMLLSDVKANDGVIHVFKFSLRRRSHMHSELSAVHAAIERGELKPVGCCVPVVVTFHDVNTFTARHFHEYLHILMEEAARVGLQPASIPFYDARLDVESVALLRTQPVSVAARVVPTPVALRASARQLDKRVLSHATVQK